MPDRVSDIRKAVKRNTVTNVAAMLFLAIANKIGIKNSITFI